MSTNESFENSVFRYRSIDALLGQFKELERQSIYFSPPDQLNDPMEGMRQVYWRGDAITWRNLLRHYVICLYNRVFQFLVSGEGLPMNKDGISVFQNLGNLPTSQARKICEACLRAVGKTETYDALLDLLSNADRNISRTELATLLTTVHVGWLEVLHVVFHQKGLAPEAPKMKSHENKIASILRARKDITPQVKGQISDEGLDVLNEVSASRNDQIHLIAVHNNENVMGPNRASLLLEFPQQYLLNLMKLVYPPWYVSCFSMRHDNAVMWSHYANDHQGCCLVFKSTVKINKRTISLTGPIGYGSNELVISAQEFPLENVTYSDNLQNIEFFSSIGRLSFNSLMRHWFQSEDGLISKLAQHMGGENEVDWRKAYWDKFKQPLLNKLPDWQYEQETRVILSDILSLHDKIEGRIFNYDFEILEGIIFGMNAAFSDKLRIMKIVSRKLENNSREHPFKFYQASYSPRTRKIEVVQLSILNFQSGNNL